MLCLFCILEKEYLSTKVITGFSHYEAALLRCFMALSKNCARQTINYVVSKIKQLQLQLCD